MALCPITKCGATLKDEKYIMCYSHWHMVPKALQRTIWNLWHGGHPHDGYAEACASAVQQVLETLRAGNVGYSRRRR